MNKEVGELLQYGKTALIVAAEKGHLHVAEALIKNGAKTGVRIQVTTMYAFQIFFCDSIENDKRRQKVFWSMTCEGYQIQPQS